MPSLFSARSFADRAAARRTARGTPSDADPKAQADTAGPGTTSDAAPAETARKAAADPAAGAPPGLAEAPARFGPATPDRPASVAEAPRPAPGLAVRGTVPADDPGAPPQRKVRRKREQPDAQRPATGTARAEGGRSVARAPTLLTPQPPAGTVRLVPLQALCKGGRWRTEAMRSYRFPVLLWFTRGQGRITISGLTRGYGAHNAVFVPPRCMHGFEVTAQVYGTAVFFNAEHDMPLPDRPLHLRVRDAVAQGEVTTILEQLSREAEGDRPHRERAIRHHAGLLSVWLDRQVAAAGDAAGVGGKDTAALRLVRRYTEMIEAQLFTGQGVGDYAEALGVTPTHLSRVCRETAGRSASDILADRVTFEARRLLAETTLPIKQVAQVLGYGSAGYFTRAFQNRTGTTPSQFRAGG